MPAPEERDDNTDAGPAKLLARLLQLGALALVAALLGLLLWRVVTVRGTELVADIRANKRPPAPAFELPIIWNRPETWPPDTAQALRDGRVALTELRGRPVVVNFWASWCSPCKKEAPILAASARAHHGQVVFLGVDVQDFASDARSFLERYGANYVSVRDSGSSTYTAYGLSGLPETFYIDAQGRALHHTIGELTRDELERGIAASRDSAP